MSFQLNIMYFVHTFLATRFFLWVEWRGECWVFNHATRRVLRVTRPTNIIDYEWDTSIMVGLDDGARAGSRTCTLASLYLSIHVHHTGVFIMHIVVGSAIPQLILAVAAAVAKLCIYDVILSLLATSRTRLSTLRHPALQTATKVSKNTFCTNILG